MWRKELCLGHTRGADWLSLGISIELFETEELEEMLNKQEKTKNIYFSQASAKCPVWGIQQYVMQECFKPPLILFKKNIIDNINRTHLKHVPAVTFTLGLQFSCLKKFC